MIMLKSLQAVLALSLVLTTATGAFAAGRGGLNSGFHGNTPYESTLSNFPDAQSGRAAFAAAPGAAHATRNVYAPNGTYLGADPDANVRLELRRDECTWGC
jgi:hypothetical protein